MPKDFQTFSRISTICLHNKWKKAWLLLLQTAYKGGFTIYQMSEDLRSEEIRKF